MRIGKMSNLTFQFLFHRFGGDDVGKPIMYEECVSDNPSPNNNDALTSPFLYELFPMSGICAMNNLPRDCEVEIESRRPS